MPNHSRAPSYCIFHYKMPHIPYNHRALILLSVALVISATLTSAADNEQPIRQRPWLRARSLAAASRTGQQQQQPQQAAPSQPTNTQQTTNNTTTSTIAAPANKPQASTGTATEVSLTPSNKPQLALVSANNRTTRTAGDIFQNGDGYNIFVTNTCERESMKVNIRTSKPFYGIIHTRDQRAKQICTAEGNGDTEYNLEINHVLNDKDPGYCGVIRGYRASVEDKEILSVIVAIRLHRTIELSDDKFFLLNCTNRCRKPDCSVPSSSKLLADDDDSERETERTSTPLPGSLDRNPGLNEECTIWKFPWVITLLWCLGILLLAMIISHCIMCSSMVCRCVKTEVEETEPSIYEGASDSDDDRNRVVSGDGKQKKSKYTIDYDNKDIYTTSNNYSTYNLDDVQSKSARGANRYRRNNN